MSSDDAAARQGRALANLDAACRANDRRGAGGPPRRALEIADMERHLANTLRRSGVAPSLARQASKMAAQTARANGDGRAFVAPGRKQMAEWGGCDPKTAQRNFQRLHNCGVVAAEPPTRGRGHRRAWRVDYHGLIAWMGAARIGFSRELDAKLRRALFNPLNSAPEQSRKGDAKRGREKGTRKGTEKGTKPPRKPLNSQGVFLGSLYIQPSQLAAPGASRKRRGTAQ